MGRSGCGALPRRASRDARARLTVHMSDDNSEMDPLALGAQLPPVRRYPGIHPAPGTTQEVDAGRVARREGQEFREDSNEALPQ